LINVIREYIKNFSIVETEKLKMLKFTAFDVQEGDAFLLEKDEKKILIDGGKDRGNKFPEKFLSTGIKQLDLIVCTHADSDHAEGLINLLRSDDDLTCKEIWIPAKWQRYIDKIKANRVGFIIKLIHEIKFKSQDKSLVEMVKSAEKTYELEPEEKVFENVESIYSNFSSITYCREMKDSNGYKTTNPSQYEKYLLIKLAPSEVKHYSNGFLFELNGGGLILHLHGIGELTDSQFEDFREALGKYGKLEALLDEVNKKSIKISWFELVENPMTKEDYDAYDEQGLLTPLCHYKITTYTHKRSSEPILEMLPKYNPNKISLVLASKRTDTNPLIIFSSDSDFEKIENIPSEENMLITVPHHGSKSNIEALDKCIEVSKGKNPLWIRGDSHRITMSESFITKVKSLEKTYCTLCRDWYIDSQGGNPSSEYQLISIIYDSCWKNARETKLNLCKCQRTKKKL
jgi:Metallo-beta-lactamase superfamily